MALNGFLPPDEPLSARGALTKLDWKIKAFVAYEPQSLWEHDTARLPRPLRGYRRQLREFAERVLRPHAARGDLDPHHPEGFHDVLVAAGREGHLTEALPRPMGSTPLTRALYPLALQQSLKTEELCAVCGGLGLTLGANGLGTAPIVFSGNVKTILRHLVPGYRATLRGEPYMYAFAITEPSAGSDVEESHGAKVYRPMTTARRTEGGWVLNGRKVFISGGDIADAVTVFAALEGEGMESWTCFLVEKSMPGYAVARTEDKMGQRASGAAELVFEDVFVPDTHIIGGLRQGWTLNRTVLNTSRYPVAGIALGIARGAFESSLRFAADHRLGGRALVDYQDVQLSLAQMMLDLNAMRSTIWQGANTWSPTQAGAAMTKVFCSDTAVRVCETAMELMGNHGLLHGGPEKAFRDARLTQIYEGTNQINRLAIIEDQMEEILALATKV